MTSPNRYPRRPPQKPLSFGDWIVFVFFCAVIAGIAWFITASSACLWPGK